MSERELTHYRLLDPFQTDFVAAADLKGRDAVMTIERVSVDELPVEGTSDKQRKVIVSFVGAKKRMVLNKTNARIIAKLYGPLTADWIGKRVALYPTMTKFGRDRVECIRIREKAPTAKATAPTPDHDPATGDGPPPDEYPPAAA